MSTTTAAKFLSVTQVMAELAVGRDYVLDAIARGALPAFKDGRLVRVARTDLDEFIASRRTTGRAPRRIGRAS